MSINTDQIEGNDNYRLKEVVEFGNVIPFILMNIKRKSPVSAFYFLLNVITLLALVIISIVSVTHYGLSAGKLIQYIFLGIIGGTLFIIPIHEFLHYLAYLFMGARKIKFGADPRQLIFYVVADRFPIKRHQLAFLALTPFVVINLLTTCLALPALPSGTIIGGFLLLTHNIMCIGDFAMLSYAMRKENKNLISFDVVEKKKSYFFERIEY